MCFASHCVSLGYSSLRSPSELVFISFRCVVILYGGVAIDCLSHLSLQMGKLSLAWPLCLGAQARGKVVEGGVGAVSCSLLFFALCLHPFLLLALLGVYVCWVGHSSLRLQVSSLLLLAGHVTSHRQFNLHAVSSLVPIDLNPVTWA